MAKLCPLKIQMLKFKAQISQNVSVFGETVFKEVRSLRVGPSPIRLGPYKRRKFGHRRAPGESGCEDTQRRWPSSSQGERPRDSTLPSSVPPSPFSEGTNPADTLISAVQPPELRENRLLLFNHFLVLCYGRPSKLIQT